MTTSVNSCSKNIGSRNSTVDIIKALAIILMVYGHTFGYFRSYVYLFHMPIFFTIAGYCWNIKHSESIQIAGNYIVNRYLRLMFPYFMVNLIFILFHNIFVRIGMLSDNYEFMSVMCNAPATQDFSGIINSKTVLMNLYNAMCFEYNETFAGVTWFLYTLFFINFINCLFSLCTHNASRYVRTTLYLLLFFTCTILAGYISKGIGRDLIKQRHIRILLSYIPYLIGVFIKKIGELFENAIRKRSNDKFNILCWSTMIAGSGVCLWLLNGYGKIEISKGIITNIFFYLNCIIAGCMLLYGIARIIMLFSFKNFFEYIGQHTMVILFFHTVAFKIVSIIVVIMKRLPKYMIASFPIIFNVNEFTKVCYTFTGVVLPLLIVSIYEKVRLRLKR